MRCVWADRGRVVVALSKKIHTPLGAFGAEAKAFEVVVQFAKDVGIHDLTLEGDSLTVCHALNELDAVIPSLQGSCREFRRILFSHVRCQENIAAHLLAKHAKCINDFCT